ncbi:MULTISPECIES: DNA repair protein RecN [Virgibacillus]|uniref:DNA repair protein RecN n=1 Tax=Virgibacillus dokdonensis TaxID=302167 RepID=A0A2K9J3R9_9BACI|nr:MULTISPECIES: DNA repair protein RecN [Virgibacillus]AUJ26315.1 DNA repair protein RecN [Virgibacillus dokdonensis]NWO14623.1 DNA repair protein RecN [Virgibacillus sp.]
MLTELSIQDFAIINKLSVTFNEGLTVLTGETGAGKSIIIDAVQLLAGGRGSVEFVRHGAKKADIEGLFIIDHDSHPVYTICEQYGIESEDQQLVLRRTITANGKSICRVNSKLVTLAVLREFGRTLIDIHSQHETQSLMNPEHHLDLLDLYQPELINKAKKEYLKLYDQLSKLKNRYRKLSENEQETAQRLDLLQFQLRELEEAQLQPNEDKQLEEERNTLANFERIYSSLQLAYNSLYGEQKGLDWVNQAQIALQDNSNYDASLAQKAEDIANYYYGLEELTYDLGNQIETLQFDPERLNEIEARLNEINRLKRKYGPTVSDMLTYMAKIEEEVEEISNKDSHISKLEQQIKEKAKDAFLEAQELRDIRIKAAEALTKEIHEELKDLYLGKTEFKVDFAKNIEPQKELDKHLHKNGMDDVTFLISTNPGEPPKPLNKVASGGELSRIMLSLKKIFARHQGVTSVIFDEVDTGVSGRVAQAIAEKIYHISQKSQVLCITHLPQVAAMADTHKLIEKEVMNQRTSTTVHELSQKLQINELARMITGTKLTDTAVDHAREMLEMAIQFKGKEHNL